jgi:hypothetical protein
MINRVERLLEIDEDEVDLLFIIKCLAQIVEDIYELGLTREALTEPML